MFNQIVIFPNLFIEFWAKIYILMAEYTFLLTPVEFFRGMPFKLASCNKITRRIISMMSSCLIFMLVVGFGSIVAAETSSNLVVNVPYLFNCLLVYALLGWHHFYCLVYALSCLGQPTTTLRWRKILELGWSFIKEGLWIVSILGFLSCWEVSSVIIEWASLLVGRIIAVVHLSPTLLLYFIMAKLSIIIVI